MSASWCRVTALVCAAALALGSASSAAAQPLAASPPSGVTAPAAPPAPSAPASTRAVDYRGVHLSVPSDWPVVDLDVDRTRCLRLDIRAVYVGRPGNQQDCPAHRVGRADTIWLHPGSDRAAAGSTATTSNATTVGTLNAHTGSDRVARTKVARFTAQDVQVEATWASRESTVDDVLATAATSSTTISTTSPSTRAGTAAASSTSGITTSTTTGTTSTARTTSTLAAATPAAASGPRVFTGMGFDSCAAPSLATMQSWLASPYRAAGIYIGGSMRACPDGNLSASWVSQVSSMGWGLIPIYVGPQAPCVNQTNLATIDPAKAAAQGKAAAVDAAGRAADAALGVASP